MASSTEQKVDFPSYRERTALIVRALGDGEPHWPEEIRARAAEDWGLGPAQLAEHKPGVGSHSHNRWVHDVGQVLAHRKDLIEGRAPGPYRLTELGRRDLSSQSVPEAPARRRSLRVALPWPKLPRLEWPPPRRWADQLAMAAITLAVLSLGAGAFTGVLVKGSSVRHRVHARTRRAAPGATSLPPGASLVAGAQTKSVAVYPYPGAPSPLEQLSNPNDDGAPLTFLVKSVSHGWDEVYLPSLPNSSVGWIQQQTVSLAVDPFRVEVDLKAHRLIAWREDKVIMRTPVGVGEAVSPTPSGLYYITELLKQSDPYGPYGPYAFGLSVHSAIAEIRDEFPASGGRIGLHGTDDPSGLGTDVSHGCIRLSNDDITELAHLLPAGTPVLINAGGQTLASNPPPPSRWPSF